MSDVLHIAALPIDIKYGDVEANLGLMEKMIEAVPKDTDLVVLPELFTTSFIADAELLQKVAESMDGPTMKVVKAMAASHGIAICGSFIVIENDEIFNRAFFVEPSGKTTLYDKRHLFCLSPEAQLFRAGNRPIPVVEYKGWKIAMMVCYDLRFPVWSRNLGHAYDLLLIPANWPHAREYAWSHLLIARAIENQAVVVGCNRSGRDDFGEYDNLTFIFDALGMPIGTVGEEYGIVYASPSLEAIQKSRRRLPVCTSADDFDIRL